MSKAIMHLVLVSAAVGGRLAQAQSPADVQKRSMTTFQESVRPILQRYCVGCHGPKKREAKLRLDSLDPNIATGSDGETWHDALNKLNLGEMPPQKSLQPSAKERETLVNWITAELKRAYQVRRSTGGRAVIRRLTRYEYANTLRDLLGLDIDFSEDLPQEPRSRDGLRNNGSSLGMSPQQLEHYLKIARMAIGKAIVTGDQPRTYSYQLNGSKLSAERGALFPPNVGTMVFREYPSAGTYRIRVTVSATSPKPGGDAIMRLALGIRPSPKNLKFKTVAEVKVAATGNTQTFEFLGRLENIPTHDPNTPDKERRFPGLRLGIFNMSFDQPGQGKSRGNRKRRRKKNRRQITKPAGNKSGPVLSVQSVSFEAPVFDSWPPKHHTRILFPSTLAKTDERNYARQVLERFMKRAYRRPVTKDEVGRKLNVYDAYRRVTPTLELAMREVLPEILVSPDFLYLVEPTNGKGQKQAVTDYELASRLSYFLWSTMPDDKLFKLAQSGKLRDASIRQQTVRAMLKDKRSWRFVENFTDQWLNLSGLNRVAVNPDYYPEFDDRLKEYMRQETQHFFAELLRNDLSALNLIDSKFTMLNKPLADHYGISGPKGNTFERVALKPEYHRGGLLGHGSILLTNSNGEDSHPVLRGVWIRDRLLGDPPASPPPDVPNLKKDNPDVLRLSLRKQLLVHRQKASCNSCHRNIDPWGIALENFDAVGRWRTSIRKATGTGTPATVVNGVVKRRRKRPSFTNVPVDANGTLPDGKVIRGIAGLKSHLLQNERRRFAEALVRRLLAYSLGRSLELVDNRTVNSLTRTFEESGYQLDELIVAITKSEPFRTK